MKYYIIAFLMFGLMTKMQSSVKTTTVELDSITVATVEPKKIVLKGNTEWHREQPPFDFNTSGIEQHEGCTDSLVYPGGISGPTISCGLDIGNVGKLNAAKALKNLVHDSVYQILMEATSIRGEDSKAWIRQHQVHVGRHTAVMICNRVKMIFWKAIVRKYPNMENAPSSVKTGMLDLAFQAGVGSKRMEGLSGFIRNSDWVNVGVFIENSYNDFNGGKYHSIYLRRVRQGKAIQLSQTKQSYEIDYD